MPRLDRLAYFDHDTLINFVAAEHIDWTSTTSALLTTGSGRFDGGIGVGVAPTTADLLNFYRSAAGYTGIKLANAGAGDQIIRFFHGGALKWIIGNDSTADSFTIGQTGASVGFGSPVNFILDSSGNFDLVSGDLTTLGSITAADYDGLDLAGEADGFSIAGGTQSRALVVTGGDWTLDQDVSSRADPALLVRPTVTFVVAATDSLAATKAKADYQCDGIDDEVQIQAALDALPAHGGEVFCLAGAYSIQDTIEIPDNTTLHFENGNSITVPGTGPTDWTFKKGAPLTKHGDNVYCMFTNDDHSGGNTRVKIVGAQIDFGSGTGETSKYDGYYGAAGDSDYSVWAAVWFDNCTESVIEDCYGKDVLREGEAVKGCQYGLLFSDCADSVIRHCQATGSGYEGIGIRDDNDRILVEDCWGTGNDFHLLQCAAWSPAGGGAYPGSPENIVIRNIRGPTISDGICVHGILNDALKGIIIEECTTGWIKAIGDLHSVSIINNSVEHIEVGTVNVNGTAKGVSVSGNIIDAVSYANNHAISILTGTQAGGHVKQITIQNNIITDGIIYVKSDAITTDITDIEIIGNMFVLDSETELDLIHLQNYSTNDMSDISIRDNHLTSYTSGTANHGVLIEVKSAADITHTEIIGNRFYGYYAVKCARSAAGQILDIRIIGNQIYAGNAAFRFGTTTTAVGILIAGNDFEYINYGIEAGGDILVRDNTVGTIGTAFETSSPSNVRYINNNAQIPIALASGSRSIVHIENGLAFTNAGASGSVQFDLPAARVGMEFRFIVVAAQQLQIDPNGTETIAIGNSQQAAGKYVWADAAGETVLLRCIKAGEWEDWQSLGTWTAEA